MEENKQLIRQSNVLTESRYDFDPIEKRCIYTIIQKVRKTMSRGREASLIICLYICNHLRFCK